MLLLEDPAILGLDTSMNMKGQMKLQRPTTLAYSLAPAVAQLFNTITPSAFPSVSSQFFSDRLEVV
jgi:hypothetical protein